MNDHVNRTNIQNALTALGYPPNYYATQACRLCECVPDRLEFIDGDWACLSEQQSNIVCVNRETGQYVTFTFEDHSAFGRESAIRRRLAQFIHDTPA